jgi:hypothetical protein
MIRGYFQYLPAIAHIIPTIRLDILEFLRVPMETLRQKYSITNPMKTGFIHVRRGDYLKAEPGFHWVQTSEYYRAALTHMRAERWLVISDDIQWCNQQDWLNCFDILDEPDELYGLAIMSLCHGGAIIANSTYSWWGAMLGSEPAGSPVVYPSKWLQNRRPQLFPPGWIRI